MIDLHPQQVKILQLLQHNDGKGLSLNDIKEAIGARHRSLVQHHISQLERKMYLRRNPSNPRDFQILKDPSKLYTLLNVYGSAQCGFSGSLLSTDPIDRVSISPSFVDFDITKAYIVIAQGDSMTPVLNDGDRLLVEQNHQCINGKIHIVTLDGEVMVKKVMEDDNSFYLVSMNDSYLPKTISKPDIIDLRYEFYIEGIVRGKFTSEIY